MPNSRSQKESRGGLLGQATRSYGGRKASVAKSVNRVAEGSAGKPSSSPKSAAVTKPSSYAPSGGQSPVRSFYGAPMQEAGKPRPISPENE